MAFYPKQIPTLRGNVASRFNKIAETNETQKKGSVDFSKEVAEARAILIKSRMGNRY